MSAGPIDYMPAAYERALAQREEQIAAWRKQDDEDERRRLQVLAGVMLIALIAFIVAIVAAVI